MRRATIGIVCGAITGALFFGVFASGPAAASRSATAKETRGMWRAVERDLRKYGGGGGCTHHPGVISTVKTGRYHYGTVLVSDAHCGDGTFVLRRAAGDTRWRKVTSGSDIGAPDRCGDDLRRIPVAVYRDLFPRDPNCP